MHPASRAGDQLAHYGEWCCLPPPAARGSGRPATGARHTGGRGMRGVRTPAGRPGQTDRVLTTAMAAAAAGVWSRGWIVDCVTLAGTGS